MIPGSSNEVLNILVENYSPNIKSGADQTSPEPSKNAAILINIKISNAKNGISGFRTITLVSRH